MMLIRILLRWQHVPAAAVCWMIFLKDFLHVLIVTEHLVARRALQEPGFTQRCALRGRDPEHRRGFVVLYPVEVDPTITAMWLVHGQRRIEGRLQSREKVALHLFLVRHSENREERLRMRPDLGGAIHIERCS